MSALKKRAYAAAITMFICYFMVAFVMAEFNPFAWSIGARAGLAAIGGWFAFGAAYIPDWEDS